MSTTFLLLRIDNCNKYKLIMFNSVNKVFSMKILNLAIVVLLLLTSCSNKNKDELAKNYSVEELYNKAMDKLDKKSYTEAAEAFATVQQEHPFSKWAIKAEVMEAYCYYLKRDYDQVTIIVDEFVKLHPSHPDVPYAYYLKGLSYYDQIADIKRDQKITEEALVALNEVVSRFPSSEYARDAKIKLDLVNDRLAGKEMEIGRFYLKRGELISALNRFQLVVDGYQTTVHAPEALYRIASIYLALGVKDEAERYAAVLGYNYPSSKWYKHSYNLIKVKNQPVIKKDKK
jgi:outer membrane protein assembly factor BamD